MTIHRLTFMSSTKASRRWSKLLPATCAKAICRTKWPTSSENGAWFIRTNCWKIGRAPKHLPHWTAFKEQTVIQVLQLKPLGDFQLDLSFSDGSHGVFDGTEYLASRNGPMLEPLRNAGYFARCFVEAGGLCWPNGFELSPTRAQELCRLTVAG